MDEAPPLAAHAALALLPLLPSDRQIVQAANSDVVLCILQGLTRTKSHIPPNGKWAELDPFHGRFR